MTKTNLILQAMPVSTEAFKPFGTLLDAALADPRLNFTVQLTNPRAHARPNFALIRPPISQKGLKSTPYNLKHPNTNIT